MWCQDQAVPGPGEMFAASGTNEVRRSDCKEKHKEEADDRIGSEYQIILKVIVQRTDYEFQHWKERDGDDQDESPVPSMLLPGDAVSFGVVHS
jgi:hypothetical protein